MKTGVVKDWRYMEHDMGPFHPESPARIEAVYMMMEREIRFPLLEIEPRPAAEEDILLIHTPAYLNRIKETEGKERVSLDPDTSTSPRSYEVARLAAGGLLKAADLIMEGKIRNGFGLVRPPGHHAEASRAMGFCLFNNVAVAAEHLVRRHGLKRILIADWDLHHGNGTQNSFYRRKDVLFFSTHQYPHYPGSGFWNEVGEGEGEGYTVNVPLSPGKTDEDYLFIYREGLLPVADQFRPQFILVSAGFDIYRGDPLGGMKVSEEGFGALAAELIRMAEKHSNGKILFTLEGGYNLQGLQGGVKEVLFQLSGRKEPPPVKAEASPETTRELAPLFKLLEKHR